MSDVNDIISKTGNFSLHCVRHSPYAANNETVSACRTFVLLQDAWILSICVHFRAFLFLGTEKRRSVLLHLVLFVLKNAKFVVKILAVGASAHFLAGDS